MTDILWNIDVDNFDDEDGYHMAVSALTSGGDGSDVEVTVHSQYDRQPTQIDAGNMKDEALEILFDAGLYSGGNDE